MYIFYFVIDRAAFSLVSKLWSGRSVLWLEVPLTGIESPHGPPVTLLFIMSWHTNTNINTKIWKYSRRMGKKGSILDDDVCTRKINLQGYLVHQSFAERNVSVSVKRKWKPQELKRLKPSSPKYEGNIGGQTLLEFDVHSIFLTAALFLGTALLGYSLTTAFSAVWRRLSGQSLELAYLQMPIYKVQ